MTRLTIYSIVWFALALLGVYVLWSGLRWSFVEAEPAPPKAIPDRSHSKTINAPVVLASAANIDAGSTDVSPTEETASLQSATECREEIIVLIVNSEEPKSLCVVSRDVIQNGASRTYQFSTKGNEPFQLRVRANGAAIEAVELHGGKRQISACEAEQCSGIAIGKRDSIGRRSISIDMLLKNTNENAAEKDASIRLRANLKTKPDHEVAALTCAGQGVTMIGNDNSSVNFCPLGGNGFSASEDGSSITYQFSNLEGEMITVAVDAQELIQKIGFDADRLSCAAADCAGVQLLPPNDKGERVFSFSGVTLRESGGGESMILNGTLILQPLSLN